MLFGHFHLCCVQSPTAHTLKILGFSPFISTSDSGFSPSSHSHSTQIHRSTVGSLDLLVLFSPIHRNFCFRLLWRRKNKNGTKVEVEAVKRAVEYNCRKLLRVVRWTTGHWVYRFYPIFFIHVGSLRTKALSDFLHNPDRRSLRFPVKRSDRLVQSGFKNIGLHLTFG